MITVVTTVSDSNSHQTYSKSNFVIVDADYSDNDLYLFAHLIFEAVSLTINSHNEVNK